MISHGRILILAFAMAVVGAAVFYELFRTSHDAHQQIYDVIRGQLSSIEAGDYARARGFTTQALRDQLTTSDFARLLQLERRSLRRASHVEFGPVWRQGRYRLVQVFFVHPDGRVRTSVYTLVREDGAWRIRAARIEEDDGERLYLPGARA